MAISRQLDNMLNKLNKKLQSARLAFGVSSKEYQSLSKEAMMVLGKYNLINQKGVVVKIKRTNPTIAGGKTINDFNADLTKLEKSFAKMSVAKARGQYMKDVREDRMAAGETRKQAYARPVTSAEIIAKARQAMDLDEDIETALEILYHERTDVRAKLNHDNAYRQWFDQIDALCMTIMHKSRKTYGELHRVVQLVGTLTNVRSKLDRLTVNTPTGLTAARSALSDAIDSITLNPRRNTALKNKFKI